MLLFSLPVAEAVVEAGPGIEKRLALIANQIWENQWSSIFRIVPQSIKSPLEKELKGQVGGLLESRLNEWESPSWKVKLVVKRISLQEIQTKKIKESDGRAVKHVSEITLSGEIIIKKQGATLLKEKLSVQALQTVILPKEIEPEILTPTLEKIISKIYNKFMPEILNLSPDSFVASKIGEIKYAGKNCVIIDIGAKQGARKGLKVKNMKFEKVLEHSSIVSGQFEPFTLGDIINK